MSLSHGRRHEIARVEAFSDAVMGPAHWLYGSAMGRKRRALIAASA
jgi:hypothetical protein